jgi:predicted enzyme related to lactoylglutathione lyase
MKRFVIERNLPGVQNMAPGEYQEAAARSNAAIAGFGGKLTWEHSYVVQDKTFCIYIADSADTVMKHAKASGFPASKVTEVRTVIEPMTGV